MSRLVSVITPTYNHADFIAACIESVQAQTYPDWEMIVVDDGSTDETGAIAQRYAAGDDRIHVFLRENVGILRLAETYNFGLSQASGDWIGILEGDDVWAPQKLDLQTRAFEANPDAIMSWGDVTITSSSLEPIGVSRSTEKTRDRALFDNRPAGTLLNELYLENIVSATTLLIRRNELDAIGGFQHREGLPLIDYPTILALAVRGPFAYVAEPLARWRWHPDQVTKSYYAQIIRGVRDVALEHFDSLNDSIRENVDVTRGEIEEHYRRVMHDSYIQSGRYKLLQKRFRAARSDYIRALFYPSPIGPANRLIALAGIASSLGGTDLEWLARLLGKKPIT